MVALVLSAFEGDLIEAGQVDEDTVGAEVIRGGPSVAAVLGEERDVVGCGVFYLVTIDGQYVL